MATVKIENTADGQHRVFTESEDGFEVHGVRPTKDAAERLRNRVLLEQAGTPVLWAEHLGCYVTIPQD